jgi:hypothetical protein
MGGLPTTGQSEANRLVFTDPILNQFRRLARQNLTLNPSNQIIFDATPGDGTNHLTIVPNRKP